MKKTLFILLCVLIAGYALFEAWRLIEGPQLSIAAPLNGSAVSTQVLTVEGTAKNISFMTINDRPSYTDENGNFTQTFSPPPGYTVVTVAAVDRFGRKVVESVSVTMLNYCPLS